MTSSSSSSRWSVFSKNLYATTSSCSYRYLSSTARRAGPGEFTATLAPRNFGKDRQNRLQADQQSKERAEQVSRATLNSQDRRIPVAGTTYNRQNAGGGREHDPAAVPTKFPGKFGVGPQDSHAPRVTAGQYYDPSSLGPPPSERQRPSARPLLGPSAAVARELDPLYQNDLHPARPSLRDDSYKNGALLSAYISEMGRILPRSQTNLTRRSQREVGKAIRRARSMGILPNLSRGSRGGLAGWGPADVGLPKRY